MRLIDADTIETKLRYQELPKDEKITWLEAYMHFMEIIENALTVEQFPCKVGDIIYEVSFGEIIPGMVTGFRIGKLITDDEDDEGAYSDTEWNIDLKARDMISSVRLSEFGKTLFLTKEEAKKAK